MIDSACPVVCYSIYSSPIGELLLTSDGEALTGLHMCQHRGRPAPGPEAGWQRDDSAFRVGPRAVRCLFRG